MAIAAENSKAKQDTEKKSQEVWNEAKAKHEAASNAADVAIKKFEEARKIAQAYRKEQKLPSKYVMKHRRSWMKPRSASRVQQQIRNNCGNRET